MIIILLAHYAGCSCLLSGRIGARHVQAISDYVHTWGSLRWWLVALSISWSSVASIINSYIQWIVYDIDWSIGLIVVCVIQVTIVGFSSFIFVSCCVAVVISCCSSRLVTSICFSTIALWNSRWSLNLRNNTGITHIDLSQVIWRKWWHGILLSLVQRIWSIILCKMSNMVSVSSSICWSLMSLVNYELLLCILQMLSLYHSLLFVSTCISLSIRASMVIHINSRIMIWWSNKQIVLQVSIIV